MMKPQSERKRSLPKLMAWIFVLSGIGIFMLSHHAASQPKKVPMIIPVTTIIPRTTPKVLSAADSQLDDVVTKSLAGADGTIAVSITNLKTGESYNLNPHMKFESGSLYKLWVMATVYEEIEDKALSEDETLSESVGTLNTRFNIASDDAELTDGQVTFTVHNALQQMITISHNYAAMLLTEKVGLNTLQSFLGRAGLRDSHLGIDTALPTTSAADISHFLQEVYTGSLTNETYTNEMLGFLQDQQLNNKLPRFLPDDVIIAHKTGELDQYSHDAGIVYTPQGNYIIVVLTKSNYPPDAEDAIANLSKAVYDYFTKGGGQS